MISTQEPLPLKIRLLWDNWPRLRTSSKWWKTNSIPWLNRKLKNWKNSKLNLWVRRRSLNSVTMSYKYSRGGSREIMWLKLTDSRKNSKNPRRWWSGCKLRNMKNLRKQCSSWKIIMRWRRKNWRAKLLLKRKSMKESFRNWLQKQSKDIESKLLNWKSNVMLLEKDWLNFRNSLWKKKPIGKWKWILRIKSFLILKKLMRRIKVKLIIRNFNSLIKFKDYRRNKVLRNKPILLNMKKCLLFKPKWKKKEILWWIRKKTLKE